MPSPIFLSRPPPEFSLLAIARGVQLGILGAYRSLQNPNLLRHEYYKQAVFAIIIAAAIQILLWLPFAVTKFVLYLLARFIPFISYRTAEQDLAVIHALNTGISWLGYLYKNIFNVHPLLIRSVRFIRPEIDSIFLESLQFADKIYSMKHPGSHSSYYHNLVEYGTHTHTERRFSPHKHKWMTYWKLDEAVKLYDKFFVSPVERDGFLQFVSSYMTRTTISLVILIFSRAPYIGPVVVFAVAFHTFYQYVGVPTALCIFAASLAVDRVYLIWFLSVFYGSRSLIQELLIPYFSRLPFTRLEKKQWMNSRSGVLFGFGLLYYFLIQVPYFGLLFYGVAEAASAYLIFKVSDPVPPLRSRSKDSRVPKAVMLPPAWIEAQKAWTRGKKAIGDPEWLLDDDGYAAVPGSFMLYQNDNNNSSSSLNSLSDAFVTPTTSRSQTPLATPSNLFPHTDKPSFVI